MPVGRCCGMLHLALSGRLHGDHSAPPTKKKKKKKRCFLGLFSLANELIFLGVHTRKNVYMYIETSHSWDSTGRNRNIS